jgi:hypothetical protein
MLLSTPTTSSPSWSNYKTASEPISPREPVNNTRIVEGLLTTEETCPQMTLMDKDEKNETELRTYVRRWHRVYSFWGPLDGFPSF